MSNHFLRGADAFSGVLAGESMRSIRIYLREVSKKQVSRRDWGAFNEECR